MKKITQFELKRFIKLNASQFVSNLNQTSALVLIAFSIAACGQGPSVTKEGSNSGAPASSSGAAESSAAQLDPVNPLEPGMAVEGGITDEDGSVLAADGGEDGSSTVVVLTPDEEGKTVAQNNITEEEKNTPNNVVIIKKDDAETPANNSPVADDASDEFPSGPSEIVVSDETNFGRTSTVVANNFADIRERNFSKAEGIKT
jgi:hypothetical protein